MVIDTRHIGIINVKLLAKFRIQLLTGSITVRFIISGYPAANESYAAESAATSLETATRSEGSAASALEARYRTWDESDGIALRSDKYVGMMIIVM